MKNVATEAEKRGMSVRYIYCSSDAHSLDGIIINEMKTAVLDGTSPHVFEPQAVGTIEAIVDLGAFLDEKKLIGCRAQVEGALAEKSRGSPSCSWQTNWESPIAQFPNGNGILPVPILHFSPAWLRSSAFPWMS